jgi:hypothetical protein
MADAPNMNVAPPPDWYIHAVTLRALRGEFVALPIAPNAEPTNIYSIEAGRTRRAVRRTLRGGLK